MAKAVGIGSSELQRVSGLTYRQVDYHTRIGNLVSDENEPGSGVARTYEAREIEVAKGLKALSDLGMLGMDDGFVKGFVEWVREEGLVGVWKYEFLVVDLSRIAVLTQEGESQT